MTPSFTLELYEVLLTKFKTFSDSILLIFFQFPQKWQYIILTSCTSGEDLFLMHFSEDFNTTFGGECLVFSLLC